MSRKDTIIIAVLVNAGLLAILFATAWHGDEDKVIDRSEANQVVSQPAAISANTASGTSNGQPPKDEIDQVLQRYTAAQQAQSSGILVPAGAEVKSDQSEVVTVSAAAAAPVSSASEFVEVTVKRGDVLAKIAKANGTTVDKIMKTNNLTNVTLQIGQVLKVPRSAKSDVVTAPKPVAAADLTSGDPQYYVVQSGDNPWSIARKHQVPLDELLKLNKLNSESARNLKVGDKLRVK